MNFKRQHSWKHYLIVKIEGQCSVQKKRKQKKKNKTKTQWKQSKNILCELIGPLKTRRGRVGFFKGGVYMLAVRVPLFNLKSWRKMERMRLYIMFASKWWLVDGERKSSSEKAEKHLKEKRHLNFRKNPGYSHGPDIAIDCFELLTVPSPRLDHGQIWLLMDYVFWKIFILLLESDRHLSTCPCIMH